MRLSAARESPNGAMTTGRGASTFSLDAAARDLFQQRVPRVQDRDRALPGSRRSGGERPRLARHQPRPRGARPLRRRHRGRAAEAPRIDRDGRLLVGVPAFAALWRELPGHRWLAHIAMAPLLLPLWTLLYDALAAVLYAWNRRRQPAR